MLPRVLERRRIAIADADMAGSKQPYHAAAETAVSEGGGAGAEGD